MFRLLLISMILHKSHGHFEIYVNFSQKIERALNSNDNELSHRCKEQLLNYTEALKTGEQWALEMFDSESTIPSGILDGNEMDLGSFDECLDIKENEMYGKYCLATATVYIGIKSDHNRSIMQPTVAKRELTVKLAKCFPSGCSSSEMQKVYNKIGVDIEFTDLLCQTQTDKPMFDMGAIATLSSFGLIVGLIVLSTFYDIYISYMQKESAHIVFIAFSALSNGKILIRTNKSSNNLSCLDGIRVFSTMWVVLVHFYSFSLHYPLRNSLYRSNWKEYESNMFLSSGAMAVDTFLLITGLLIVYNYMKTYNKGTKFNILLFYLHRYLRLTPVLLAIMLFSITLLKHVGSGPLWPDSVLQEVTACEIHWWKNLLYIQNIFGRGYDICMSHTWYLGVDMQLFIFSPLLLIPLKKWPRLVLMVTLFLAVCSMVACFCIGWFFDLNPFFDENTNWTSTETDYMWLYYLAPHSRAVPWLIGIVLGYLIFQVKMENLNPIKNKIIIAILWVVAMTIIFTCVLCGHDLWIGSHNRLANSFHIALARPVWAIALSWVIFSCATGSGGPVNWFLSLPIFQVVARLTYTLYVVHLSVIFIIIAQMRVVPVRSSFSNMFEFWSYFTFSLFSAIILTIGVEFPIITIDNSLIRKRKMP